MKGKKTSTMKNVKTKVALISVHLEYLSPLDCVLSGTVQISGFSRPDHSLYCKMTKSQSDFDISLLAIACGIV